MSTVSGAYYGGIVKSGLILCLDAAKIDSYPKTGTTWTDISGNGNHGTLVNGPTFSTDSIGSIVFDGVDDYLTLGDKDSFTNPTGFTFDLFFKKADSNNVTILEKYQNTGVEYVMGIVGDSLYAWVSDQTNGGSYTGRVVPTVSTYAPSSKWSNISFVYDGGTAPTSVKIYINSTQRDNSNFNGGAFVSTTNTATPLTFGLANNGVGPIIKGSLGNVRLYNRALSAQEITQNYNALKTRFGL
jgi:hypothetical protein